MEKFVLLKELIEKFQITSDSFEQTTLNRLILFLQAAGKNGELCQSDLAKMNKMPQSTVHKNIQALRRKGLVKLRRENTQGRKKCVHLTKQGNEIVDWIYFSEIQLAELVNALNLPAFRPLPLTFLSTFLLICANPLIKTAQLKRRLNCCWTKIDISIRGLCRQGFIARHKRINRFEASVYEANPKGLRTIRPIIYVNFLK